MPRLICCVLLALICIWHAPIAWADQSVQALTKFFQGTTRSLPSRNIDFQIIAGYAILNTGNPDSTGRYAMTSINVARLAPDIYRLDVGLEKQLVRDVPTFEQPYFFTESRSYYFWYNDGEQVVFKVGNKKVPIRLGRKDVLRVDIHSRETYSIDRETMLRDISFDDGPTNIHLQLKFK